MPEIGGREKQRLRQSLSQTRNVDNVLHKGSGGARLTLPEAQEEEEESGRRGQYARGNGNRGTIRAAQSSPPEDMDRHGTFSQRQ